MSIRTKLKILSIVTLIGLGLIAFITISGLNAIRDAEEAAHRRQSYVADLIEIKASALSTIMLDPTTPETKEVFSEAASNIARHGKAAVDVIRRSEVRDELKKILAQWDSYNEASLKLLQLAAGDARLTNEKLLSLYKGEFRPFLAALEKFVAVRQDEAAQGVEQAKDVSRKILIETILVIVLVTVVNVAMVFSLSLSLQSALEGIQRQLVPLRQGDLTQRLPERNGDELGEIAAGVNAFVQEVQHIVQGTRDQSNHLANASFQLAAAAERVLQGSAQQSDATASVAASVEEFSVSIDQVSNNASQAEQKATLSGELSRNGGAEVFDAVAEIRHIEQVVSNAAGQIQALGEQARGISSIVNVIKEVADQTNLLALNAAIEAARAGEAGRGFAVVADEVRLLAERTSASAQEITSMVTSIQQSTETATGMMQQGNELVIQGVKQIEQAGNSMQQINDSSAGVRGAVSEISTSLNEQRIASVEIAKNVERIALMTEEGRTTASEVSAAARDLEQLAEALQKEVARFTV